MLEGPRIYTYLNHFHNLLSNILSKTVELIRLLSMLEPVTNGEIVAFAMTSTHQSLGTIQINGFKGLLGESFYQELMRKFDFEEPLDLIKFKILLLDLAANHDERSNRIFLEISKSFDDDFYSNCKKFLFKDSEDAEYNNLNIAYLHMMKNSDNPAFVFMQAAANHLITWNRRYLSKKFYASEQTLELIHENHDKIVFFSNYTAPCQEFISSKKDQRQVDNGYIYLDANLTNLCKPMILDVPDENLVQAYDDNGNLKTYTKKTIRDKHGLRCVVLNAVDKDNPEVKVMFLGTTDESSTLLNLQDKCPGHRSIKQHFEKLNKSVQNEIQQAYCKNNKPVKVEIIGHSLGGALASEFANRFVHHIAQKQESNSSQNLSDKICAITLGTKNAPRASEETDKLSHEAIIKLALKENGIQFKRYCNVHKSDWVQKTGQVTAWIRHPYVDRVHTVITLKDKFQKKWVDLHNDQAFSNSEKGNNVTESTTTYGLGMPGPEDKSNAVYNTVIKLASKIEKAISHSRTGIHRSRKLVNHALDKIKTLKEARTTAKVEAKMSKLAYPNRIDPNMEAERKRLREQKNKAH